MSDIIIRDLKKEDKLRKKSVLVVLFSYLMFVLFLYILGETLGVPADKYQMVSYYDMTSTVFHADGTTDIYDSSSYGETSATDRIEVEVDLSNYDTEGSWNACFHVYNAAVVVTDGSSKILEYGLDRLEEGIEIADIYFNFRITGLAKENGLHIYIFPQDGFTMSGITDMMLIDAELATKAPLVGQMPLFLLATGILMMGIVSLFIMTALALVGIMRQPKGFYLSTFFVLLSTWILGYHRIFYVFVENMEFASNAEYVALYLLPIPFCLFLMDNDRISNIIYRIFVALYSALFVGATFMNYFSKEKFYSSYLKYLHFLLMASILSIVVLAIFRWKKQTFHFHMMVIGMGLFLGCSMTDLIRIRFFEDFGESYFRIHDFLLLIGLALFSSTVIISYAMNIMHRYVQTIENKQLRWMAMHDNLTGMPNRNAFEESREYLKHTKTDVYSVLYLDINDLKVANDKYGHDMGDALICYVSEIIKGLYKDTGFYARVGGDEFVIVFFDKMLRHAFVRDVKKQIYEDNEKHLFPFRVSVAMGWMDRDDTDAMDLEEMIKKADEKMYEEKLRTNHGR